MYGVLLMWIKSNENPLGKQVGDCTVRAIAKALNKSWDEVFISLSLEGFILKDMASANAVWGAYLRRCGFVRKVVDDDCLTVADFCEKNSEGVYVLALENHAVTVISGNLYDTWNSLDEQVLYFWEKESED